MNPVFTGVDSFDLRFPTSAGSHGSDAMNPDPDYSAAYVVLRTDASDGLEGHGFAFTIGRGNEVQVAAIRALAPLVVGASVANVCANLGAFSRRLHGESQVRWLGPDKGVQQMAIAALVNAAFDLASKRAGKPLWKFLSDMSPEQIVELVDFQYLSDALTPREAREMLQRNLAGRAGREKQIVRDGYPAYTTSAGWLGYTDAKLEELCLQAVADGFQHVKLKVGRNLDDDVRRCGIARKALGPSRKLMVDANQRWGVDEAVRWMNALAPFDPWWIEEPTHPDDVVGHARIAAKIAPIRVATGEHVANAIVFKQYIESRALSVVQIDACRSGGVNDVIATMLLAAKYNLPVCPHAGGVGLCELVQHLSIFDFIAVSGSLEDRVIEFVDHLHEHFVDPVVIRNASYMPPAKPGFSSEMLPTSIKRYSYPKGAAWQLESA